jgi:uncharacterized Fe-S cluster-containing radical SAM superfamily enzyme
MVKVAGDLLCVHACVRCAVEDDPLQSRESEDFKQNMLHNESGG